MAVVTKACEKPIKTYYKWFTRMLLYRIFSYSYVYTFNVCKQHDVPSRKLRYRIGFISIIVYDRFSINIFVHT